MSLITKINIGADGKPHAAGSADKHVAVLLPQIGWMFTATPFNTKAETQRTLAKQAPKIDLLGAKDWIFPDIEILQLCADRSRRGPAFDPAHFYGIPTADWIWSSTERAGDPAFAWVVNANDGSVSYSLRNNRGFGLAARFVGQ